MSLPLIRRVAGLAWYPLWKKPSYISFEYLILVQLFMQQYSKRRKGNKVNCGKMRLLYFCSGAVQQDCHFSISSLHRLLCTAVLHSSYNLPLRKEIKTSLSWNSWMFRKLSTISRGSGSSLSVQYMAVSSASNYKGKHPFQLPEYRKSSDNVWTLRMCVWNQRDSQKGRGYIK